MVKNEINFASEVENNYFLPVPVNIKEYLEQKELDFMIISKINNINKEI